MNRFLRVSMLMCLVAFGPRHDAIAGYIVALLESSDRMGRAPVIPEWLTFATIQDQRLVEAHKACVTENDWKKEIRYIVVYPNRHQIVLWRCDHPSSSGAILVLNALAPFTSTTIPLDFSPLLGGHLLVNADNSASVVTERSRLTGGGTFISGLADRLVVSTAPKEIDWRRALMGGSAQGMGPLQEDIEWDAKRDFLKFSRNEAHLPVSFDGNTTRELKERRIAWLRLWCNDANVAVLRGGVPSAEDPDAIATTIFFMCDKSSGHWSQFELPGDPGHRVMLLSNGMLCIVEYWEPGGSKYSPARTGRYYFLSRRGEQLAQWSLAADAVFIDCWDAKAVWKDGGSLYEATLGKAGPEDKKLLLQSERVVNIVAVFKSE